MRSTDSESAAQAAEPGAAAASAPARASTSTSISTSTGKAAPESTSHATAKAERQARREARAKRDANAANSPVWRWLGRGAVALTGLTGVLVLGWVAAAVYVEKREPSAAARAMLAAPAPLPGRNAFAALWLLEQDVPPEKMQAVADADLAALLPDEPYRDRPSLKAYPSDGFADAKDGELPWCAGNVPDCLRAVRAQPQAYAALVAPHGRMWQRVADLAQYQHFQGPQENFGIRYPYIAWPRAMTAHAVALANSPSAANLRAMCRHVATSRRLAENDGSVLALQRIHAEVTRNGLQMLAQLLNENPALAPADWADCRAALAADAQWPQQVCQIMRGETRRVAASLQEDLGGRAGRGGLGGKVEAILSGLRWLAVGDDRITVHAMAELNSQGCSPAMAASLSAGQLPEPARHSSWQRALLTARAPVASALGLFGETDFRVVVRVAADNEALRAMGRSWLWWRDQLVREGPSGPLAQAMATGDVARLNALLGARPVDLQLTGHPLSVVRGEHGLVLRLALWRQLSEEVDGKTVKRERLVDLPLPRGE